jgi:hypothetical protein
MPTDWRKVVKLWPSRSLQTKATLLVISTLINIQDSRRTLERNTRDEAIALGSSLRQVSARKRS